MARLMLVLVAVLGALIPAAQAWYFAYLPCDDVCEPPASKCTKKDCKSKDGAGTLGHYKIPLKSKVCGYNMSTPYEGGNCGASQVKKPEDCCKECAGTMGCKYWQFIPVESECGCGLCFLYFTGKPKCAKTVGQYLEPPSYAGGMCNPTMSDDPHLVGAKGTHFDFVGEPDRSFCVVSDKNLHINVGLTGYMGEDLKDVILLKNGKSVHTWIKELGIVWKSGSEEHTFKLVARSGPQVTRGGGFVKSAEVDGKAMAAPVLDEEKFLAGGLKFKFVAREKAGIFDVDYFTLEIEGLVTMDLRLRVAMPTLRTAEEAYTHINIGLVSIKRTENIHGVLGQTYRADLDREQRATAFTNLVHQLHAPHVAADDSSNGNHFLDGKPIDYISSSILSTDCHFSTYAVKQIPSVSSE